MVKNKAPPDPAAHLSLVSLLLSLSLTNAVHPEGTHGSCWGWTPAYIYELRIKVTKAQTGKQN